MNARHSRTFKTGGTPLADYAAALPDDLRDVLLGDQPRLSLPTWLVIALPLVALSALAWSLGKF